MCTAGKEGDAVDECLFFLQHFNAFRGKKDVNASEKRQLRSSDMHKQGAQSKLGALLVKQGNVAVAVS
jgi:hypothetical protein